MGDEAKQIQHGIMAAKTRLTSLRTERAMTLAGHDDVTQEDGPEEIAEVREIDRLKVVFRDKAAELRMVKSEIEMNQRLLDQEKVRVQKSFETWFVELRKQTSVASLDDDTKRELYEHVTGSGTSASSGRTDVAAATAILGATNGARTQACSGSAPCATAGAAVRAAVGSSGGNTRNAHVDAGYIGGAPLARHGQTQASTPQRAQPGGGVSGPGSPSAGAVAAPGRATSTRTGDAKTDGDISEFFAALGGLSK